MRTLLDIITKIDTEMDPADFTDNQRAFSMISAIAEYVDNNRNVNTISLDEAVATQELLNKEKMEKTKQREEDLEFRRNLLKVLSEIGHTLAIRK